MKTVKAHLMTVDIDKNGYRHYVVEDCNGNKLKIIMCSNTTINTKCEASK